MNNYNLLAYKNDLLFTSDLIDCMNDIKIKVFSNTRYNKNYTTIFYNDISDIDKLVNVIVGELLYYFRNLKINKNSHIFVVGIGNDNYTADAIGPKVLKHIKVNAYVDILGGKLNGPKITALEPGVLGETGIKTDKTIKSIVKEIKPNLVILVDSLVSNDVNYLNKVIQITDSGLDKNIGIKGIDTVINKRTLGVPVLLMGVVTSILVKFSSDSNYSSYLLSTKDVDTYVDKISEVVGLAINRTILQLE